METAAGPDLPHDYELLKAEGNLAFKEKRFDEACEIYTTALQQANMSEDRDTAVALLSNRSYTWL